MKGESSNVKGEHRDLLKEEKGTKRGVIEDDKQRKSEQPWTDKERFLIVQHVLNHADYSNLFNALSDVLVKEGCPLRKRNAYSDQWRRKISKDILTLYSDRSAAEAASPTKRKRLNKKEE